MNLVRSRLVVAVLSAIGALLLAGGYQAIAQSSLLPKKPVEQRLMDLETRVLTLQSKVHALESSMVDVPRMGGQLLRQAKPAQPLLMNPSGCPMLD
jgi:hypothetical protein